jgi:hypothetical protein
MFFVARDPTPSPAGAAPLRPAFESQNLSNKAKTEAPFALPMVGTGLRWFAAGPQNILLRLAVAR